jgi:formylglycine-generating enzyme required for sulfatase activity
LWPISQGADRILNSTRPGPFHPWQRSPGRAYTVGVKRLLLIALAAFVLFLIGGAVWTLADLPPVSMVLRHGFSHAPEPTGKVETFEGVTFVEIGPGCFRMGSNKRAEGGDLLGQWCARLGLPWGDQPEPSDEMPVHWVEFRRGFFMAETEVTNSQYEAFDPKHERSEFSRGDNDPVVEVSWEDARKYCAWLGENSGRNIRLPSESEWECACRAGSRREFCFGDDEKRLGEYAWYEKNSDYTAHEVGTRRANAWGLHDFHGNVWEWCEDTYHPNYKEASADGTAWTEGGSPFRVVRGGGFIGGAEGCRSAYRYWLDPGIRWDILGFRPAYWPSDP